MNLLVELAVNYFLPTSCFFCPRIARIDTNRFNGLNGDRVGRTNWHECNEFFMYMSCGVVPLLRDFH